MRILVPFLCLAILFDLPSALALLLPTPFASEEAHWDEESLGPLPRWAILPESSRGPTDEDSRWPGFFGFATGDKLPQGLDFEGVSDLASSHPKDFK